MATTTDISILIPVRDLTPDQAQMTQNAIWSAMKAIRHLSGEVIVIDDASPCKDAIHNIQGLPSTIRLVLNPSTMGLVSALNCGASIAQGVLLTYCHSDCLIQVDTVRALLSLFKDSAVGLGTSELWYPNGDLQQVGGWIGPGFRLAWDTNLSSAARSTHWGDFWTVRHGLFDEVGGLLAFYNPGYWECVDLATSVRHMGYRVMTCPRSKVVHMKSQTFHRQFSEEERRSLFERNRQIFVRRWAARELEITNGAPNHPHSGEWK